MKKLILTIVTLSIFGAATAQIEAKINPLGAIFGLPDLSAEFVVTDYFGAEVLLGTALGKSVFTRYNEEKADQSGFEIKVLGKYYFSPDDGADGWYGAFYLRNFTRTYKFENSPEQDYERKVTALGLEFGKKWVWDTGFLLELSTGFGRALSESNEYLNNENDYDFELGLDATGRITIGYRFQ